jgi:hypothetical protein
LQFLLPIKIIFYLYCIANLWRTYSLQGQGWNKRSISEYIRNKPRVYTLLLSRLQLSFYRLWRNIEVKITCFNIL